MRHDYSMGVAVCFAASDKMTHDDAGRRIVERDDTLIYMYDAHCRRVLGKLIVKLRRRDNLNQVELAALAGISRSSVTRVERGDSVRGRQVDRIEDVLRQPLGLFEAVLRDDRGFIEQLPDLDPNYRVTILHWLAEDPEANDNGASAARAG